MTHVTLDFESGKQSSQSIRLRQHHIPRQIETTETGIPFSTRKRRPKQNFLGKYKKMFQYFALFALFGIACFLLWLAPAIYKAINTQRSPDYPSERFFASKLSKDNS